ncbi:MAG: 16S rRNA (cytidine(1402)-2'-O)-methyltransferase [Candidatus Zixiibacteriota bacterium]
MSQPANRESGVLYVVATPIGHLGDVSERALETLRTVDLICCEDTRQTRKLLTRFGIERPLLSFHDHNERERVPGLLQRLESGESLALVSDAGTPTVSDPGYRLINAAVDAGITIVPIPGPSAVTALLSVSGLPTDRFVFEGFLPVKSGRRKSRLGELASEPRTIVLFESPHRIARTLAECREAWGERRACLGRELTKKFEEIKRGSLGELSDWAGSRTLKGEITLVVAGCPTPD